MILWNSGRFRFWKLFLILMLVGVFGLMIAACMLTAAGGRHTDGLLCCGMLDVGLRQAFDSL